MENIIAQVKEFFVPVSKIIEQYLQMIVDFASNFANNAANSKFFGFIAGGAALFVLIILVGIIRWLKKSPKSFIFFVVIFAAFGGIYLWIASMA